MTTELGLRARMEARAGTLNLAVDFHMGAHTLAIVGPNGAGKSTLLGCLLGARPVNRAYLAVGGSVLCDSVRGISLPVESRQLAYVPQQYALFPHLTVRQNVAFALTSGRRRFSLQERNARIDAVLEALGIQDYGQRFPLTLSGGEQQRVAMARALVTEPRALLLDEPLAALDVHSRRQVRSFLAQYLSQLAIPTILVTHDALDARQLARQLLVLEAGRVSQHGTWEELSAEPASSFVYAFVSSQMEVV
jgi:molybdate transport system ATP-binding protein